MAHKRSSTSLVMRHTMLYRGGFQLIMCLVYVACQPRYEIAPVPPAPKFKDVDVTKLPPLVPANAELLARTKSPRGSFRQAALAAPEVEDNARFPSRQTKLTASSLGRDKPGNGPFENGSATESMVPLSGKGDGSVSLPGMPPDQGLCVGAGLVVAGVNTAIAVYDANTLQLKYGPFDTVQFFSSLRIFNNDWIVSDPVCTYDALEKRFYLLYTTGNTDTGEYYMALAVSYPSSAKKWLIGVVDNSGRQFADSLGVCQSGCFGDFPTGPGFDATNIWVSFNMFAEVGEDEGGGERKAADDDSPSVMVMALRKDALFKDKTVKGTTWFDGKNQFFTLQPVHPCGDCALGIMNTYGGTMFMQGTYCATPTSCQTSLLTFLNTKVVGTANYKQLLWRITKVTDFFPRDPPGSTLTQPKLKNPLEVAGERYGQANWDGEQYWIATQSWLASKKSNGIVWMAVKPTISGSQPATSKVKVVITASGTLYNKDNHLLYPSLISNRQRQTGLTVAVVGKDLIKGQTYTTAWAKNIHKATPKRPELFYYTNTVPLYGCPGNQIIAGTNTSDCQQGSRTGDYSAGAVDETGGLWVASQIVQQKFSQKDCPTPLCGPKTLDRVKCPKKCRFNWSTFIKKL